MKAIRSEKTFTKALFLSAFGHGVLIFLLAIHITYSMPQGARSLNAFNIEGIVSPSLEPHKSRFDEPLTTPKIPKENPPPEEKPQKKRIFKGADPFPFKSLPKDISLMREPPKVKKETLSPRFQVDAPFTSGGKFIGRDTPLARYIRSIRSKLFKAKNYPFLARIRNVEGTPKVEFIISRVGVLKSLRLLKSSGSAILDQEALKAVKQASPYPPFPKEITQNELRLTFSMPFKLK